MFCRNCGSQIPDDSKFCYKCGSQVNINLENAKESNVLEEDVEPLYENDGLNNGNRTKNVQQNLESDDSEYVVFGRQNAYQRKPKKKSSVNKKFVSSIIVKSISLMLALLMIIGFFVPIVEIDSSQFKAYLPVSVRNIEKIHVAYSPMELIQMNFDLLHNYETMDEDPLSDDLQSAMEDLADIDDDTITSTNAKYIEKVAKLTLRLSLRNENLKIQLSYILAGVVSLLYITYAVVYFILALLSLLGAIGVMRTLPSVGISTNIMSLCLPVVVIALYVLAINVFGSLLTKMGGFALALIILDILVYCVYALLYIIFHGKTIGTKEYVFRIINIVLCIVMLSCVFAPIMNANIKVEYNLKIREATFDIQYPTLNDLIVDEAMQGIYDNANNLTRTETEQYLKEAFAPLHVFAPKDIENGELNASTTHSSFLNAVIAVGNMNNLRVSNYLVVIFVLIFSISIMLSLMFTIYAFTVDNCRYMERIARIIGCVAALLTLVYVIIFVAYNNFNLHDFHIKDYKLAVGGGVISNAIISFIYIFMPAHFYRRVLKKKKSAVTVANQSNPQVFNERVYYNQCANEGNEPLEEREQLQEKVRIKPVVPPVRGNQQQSLEEGVNEIDMEMSYDESDDK